MDMEDRYSYPTAEGVKDGFEKRSTIEFVPEAGVPEYEWFQCYTAPLDTPAPDFPGPIGTPWGLLADPQVDFIERVERLERLVPWGSSEQPSYDRVPLVPEPKWESALLVRWPVGQIWLPRVCRLRASNGVQADLGGRADVLASPETAPQREGQTA